MDFDENTDDDIEDEPIDEDSEDNEEPEDIQEDYHLDDLLDQDLNWELEIARRKKRWKAKEEEMRESSGKVDSGSTLHPDSNLKGRQPKQIFSEQAASGILINDLVSIMETVGETAIRADSVEDNIFQWSVKMADFGPESVSQFTIEGWDASEGHFAVKESLKAISVVVTLKLRFFSIFMVTYLPSILMNVINQATNYISGSVAVL